ncbi:UDP-N-acetylmuramoyl-tripeptide--D-alanyl-D-alanine ligase [Brevibacillus sp. H7]|uniref:UDP-N-acetylmuramoyl-tripeptide--D-alanyl-D- alanine ligase n=1 Tax=Brevibacillus sp. H7 TaxID=3349138 RepID=UPI00382A0479
MKPISLERAASMAEGLLLQGEPASTVGSVHFDTRELTPGALFVAIQGKGRDGHDFLLQAADNGARAAIISDQTKIPRDLPAEFGLLLVNDTLRAFQKLAAAYRRGFSFPFVAVTGSNGKTTTKDMIAHLLESKLPVYKTFKNLNNHLGVPYSLLQLDDAHQAAVLELGMNHAGEIDLLASLVQPKISVITHIGDAHMEYFGSREKIALAKAELLPHTDPDGLVLLNGDNPYLRQVAHLYPGTILYYSVEGPADIWAENIKSDERGTRFDVRFSSGEGFSVFLPLFGQHNVLNALPAIAIAQRFGMEREEIQSALSTVSLSAMRFQVLNSARGAVLINDAYNASPSSMEAAISTFAELFPDRRKVLVLADMFELGSESASMHAQVGAFANTYVDRFALLISIGEQSRFIHEAYHGEKCHFAAKEEALKTLQSLDTAEHAILFKGSRGMKLETLIQELLV